jgi:hypothetical protein
MKSITMVLALLCVSTISVFAMNGPGSVPKEPVQNVGKIQTTSKILPVLIVYGYAASFVRTESSVIVKCSYSPGSVCFTIDPETKVGCIDPNGCNPEIGPTYFSPDDSDGGYYEILEQTEEYINYQIHIVPGSQRRGG